MTAEKEMNSFKQKKVSVQGKAREKNWNDSCSYPTREGESGNRDNGIKPDGFRTFT